MGFPRQEYWSGLPFPSPGDRPSLRIEPMSPALAGRFFTTEPPGKPWGPEISPKSTETRTGCYKWRSSQMTLELWLEGGNKKQEVCPELISRTNELGGKWFQLMKVRFLLQKTDGKNSRKYISYLIFNLPSNTWTIKL